MSTLTNWLDDVPGPHQGQAVHTIGSSVDQAAGAVILIHGRGATAPSILDLASLLEQPGVAYLAPQAASSTWYPYPFTQPRDVNEPGLSSAHAVISTMIEKLVWVGIEPDRIVLLGFSQGACLATDHAAWNPRRYGGVIGLSGGLIGDELDGSAYSGSLEGTPVFLGCSDIDPHIPVERVHETSEILEGMGADVTTSIYPGMGHTINPDEIDHARKIVQRIGSS
ncbi:dienelactone hydrolase family protein [soil metagenome]